MSLVVVVMAIGLTIIVINMVEELRDFIDHEVPVMSVLEYYLYFGGWVIKSFLPMFVMLATLFSVSLLARRNEVLAMKASGVSLYRFVLPYFVLALLIAAGHFYYNEYIFPPMNKRRLEIKNFTIEGKSKDVFDRVRNVTRQIRPGYFYTIGNFNVDRREGEDLKIYKSTDNRLEQITTAEEIVYDEHLWKAVNGYVRHFQENSQTRYDEFDTIILSDIEEEPSDFARRIGKPEDMSLDELKYYIDLMKRTGGTHIRESIDLKVKYSYPLASVIVVILCIPLASNPRRAGIAVSLATGAMIALFYVVLFRSVHSAGSNEKIPADLAAWGVNVLFLLIGIVLMLRARK